MGDELPKTVISDTLLKCAQGNKIAYTDFARCEMSGWDINVLTKSAKDTLIAELKKGGLL